MASPQAEPAERTASRRRQRSTRLTVAAASLAIAAVAVAGALLSGSWPLMALAAVLAVVLGAGATRITHSELVASRRDAARDRAEQAQAYRRLTEERTAEQAAFAETMRTRIAWHEATISDLENELTTAQKRVAEATRKVNAEARRADVAEREGQAAAEQLQTRLDEAEQRAAEAIVRVAELEQELNVVRADLDVARAELEVVTEAWQTAEVSARRHA